MIGNAASDMILALACGWLILAHRNHRPGLALAAMLIGVAATFGVLHYLGADLLAGAHRFASLVSMAAAFPLLAFALRWPQDPVAASPAGAVRAALLLGGVGVGATVLGVAPWAPAVALISALVVELTVFQHPNMRGIAGGTLLALGMAASAWGKSAPFSTVVILHLCLAAALLLLASANNQRTVAGI